MALRRAAALLFATCAWACAGGPAAAPPAASPDAPARPAGDAIVFWHWWTNQREALDEAAAAYLAETGERVVFEVASPDGFEYYHKIEAAMQAGTLPDVIGLAGGGERLARLVRRGAVRELTGDLARGGWGEGFFPRGLVEMTFREGNAWEVPAGTAWGVPLTVMDIQVVYNKDLFAAAGLDPDAPPATWDEWIEAGRRLQAVGIAPFGYGAGDLWMNEALFDVFAWAHLGETGIVETYAGGIPYDDARWVEAFRAFEILRDAGFFPRGIAVAPNKDAEVMFTQGEIAMAMNGSWCVDVYGTMNPHIEFGVFPFPAPPGAAHPLYLRGGVGTAAAVTTSARDPEAAVRFLRWFTAPERAARFASKARALSAVRGTAEAIPGPLGGFQAGFERVMPAIATEERRAVWDEIAQGVQSILVGRSTAEGAARRAEAARRRAATT